MAPKFMQHTYIKRQQAKKYEKDKELASTISSAVAVLQMVLLKTTHVLHKMKSSPPIGIRIKSLYSLPSHGQRAKLSLEW